MEYLFGKLRKRNLLVPFLLMQTTSLMLLFLLQSVPNLVIFRVTLGIFSLILLPGYCLMRILPIPLEGTERIGFALIFGLTYQLFVLYLMFSISIAVKHFNFQLVISFFSLIPVVTRFLIQRKKGTLGQWKIKENWSHPSYVILCVLIIIGLTIRGYYQNFSMNPHTDTSLFSEMARNLFVSGEFTSKAIHVTMPTYYQLGFHPHFFVYFSYALFFMIGGVSYSSVKLATVFYGVLVLFPIYSFMKRTFDYKVALAAVTALAFHPIAVFFSSIPINGSEIMSTMYLFSAILFIFFSLNKKNVKYAIIAGLFAFATFATRADIFYILILILPILFLTLSEKPPASGELVKVCLFAYPLFLLRFTQFSSVAILMALIYIIFTAWWLHTHKRNNLNTPISNIAVFCIMIFALQALLLLRSYSFPQLIQYAKADVLTDTSEKALYGLGSVDFNTLLSRFNHILHLMPLKLTPPIFLLSLTSVAFLYKSREVGSLLSFPFIYLIAFSLVTSPITGVDHHRFLLATFFFLIILSALVLTYAATYIFKFINSSSRKVKTPLKNRHLFIRMKTLKFAFSLIVPALVVFSFFCPLYKTELDVIKATDVRSNLNYDPAIDWILKYTACDCVLMTRKPYEFAWYTNRFSTIPWPADLTIDQLRESIKALKANYLVVDELFIYTYTNPKVRDLYLNPLSQYGFVPVFISSSNPHTIIYNITSMWSGIPMHNMGPEIDVIADDITLNKSLTLQKL